jgi:hypothetical protein
MTASVIFAPLVDWWLIAAWRGLAAFGGCALWRGLAGWWLRGLALAALLGWRWRTRPCKRKNGRTFPTS